jgi:acyl-CoA synthetase (AMP-forming)/AMP-acid ligase II
MNVAELLDRQARDRPMRPAVVDLDGVTTWGQLAQRTRTLARGMHRRGIGPGQRVAILIPPGADLVVCAHAVLAVGAEAVFLDPALGIRRLLHLLAGCGATTIAGSPWALVAERCGPRPPVPRLRLCTTAFPGCTSFADLGTEDGPWPHPAIDEDAPALCLATSGSTGAIKQVPISRAVLTAQMGELAALTRITADDVLLAVLPAMALAGPSLGCTVRVPGPRRHLVEDLSASTVSFGSPAVWEPLADRADAMGRNFPRLRCLLFGGCEIDPRLIARWTRLAPSAAIASVYGCTEAVPVACAWADEILAAPPGPGTLIGRTSAGVRITSVPITAAPAFSTGHLSGPVVAGGSADSGDVLRQDDAGRWWYLGRAADLLHVHGEVVPALVIEQACATPMAARIAAVPCADASGPGVAVVVQPRRWPWTRRGRAAVVAAVLAAGSPCCGRLGITAQRILLRRRLPVDRRHRAKVLRHVLAAWVARRIQP